MDNDLRDCLERANPNIEYRIEVAQPDVGQVLRREDQFLQAPSLVSQTPASSLSASARGSLILTPSTGALATFAGTAASFDLNAADATGATRFKGASWTLDPSFSRATLKSIVAKVQAVGIAGFFFDQAFECQIFQIVKTPGVKVKNVGLPNYQQVAFNDYQFLPLLTPAPTVKVTGAQWGVNSTQAVTFDLSNYAFTLENIPIRPVVPDDTVLLPKYLIVVRLAGQSLAGTGHYRWLTDNATAHAVSNVGTFDRVFWSRANENDQWAEQVFADAPNLTVNIETYPASGQGVFLIDQGAAPSVQSTGRVEFQRSLPPGTNATLEISTAGSGGPWTAIKHGDLVTPAQRTYHLRTTLTPDGPQHATPAVLAQGIEFRIPRDVSVEGVLDLPTREVDLPWGKSSIPQGTLRVVRTGVRDYADVGSVLGSTAPTTRLEVDVFMASRHPSITREKWFRLERLGVSGRTPTSTTEEFTLLSYASRLKRKIPQQIETISSVHKVVSSTTAQVVIDSATPLPGTTVSPGNEYDGQHYFMRVRSTTAGNTPPGAVATIQGNTGIDRLDFSPALPEALVAGDVIEVHSGIYQTQAVSWTDYDPADAWWEVLTVHLAIPPERIGLGSLPRGGRPPKVTDIAPGDATTQAKLKVTGRLSEEVEGIAVLDILSAILGGVTIEIDGQIVYVQLYPLVDLSGAVTVPLPAPVAFFDLRDFANPPDTPPGLDKRSTVLTTKFGVPATAASDDAFPSKATTAVDSDALLWLSQLDLEDYGTTDVPDEICAWLFNTADNGLYLAGTIGATAVKALSTGLRVFGLQMTEKHPRLVPGDGVVIVIDSYTDFDPSTLTPIKGPISVRGVLVRVGAEGRQLGIFVPGLRDNVQLVKGGAAGGLIGLGPQPSTPVVSASFDSAGQPIINSTGDFSTASHKIAWQAGSAPTDAAVRATSPINQQNVIGLQTGVTFAPNTKVFIAAFAYSANGLESSPSAVVSITREGSGNYQLSSLWLDVFDSMNWDKLNGAVAVIASSEAIAGPNVLEATGYTGLSWPHKIPYYSGKLYRFRIRFKKSLDDTGGNTSAIYAGVIATDYQGNVTNSNSGANYLLVAGVNYHVADGWITLDSWIRGASLAFGSAQNGSPSNPEARSPGPLNTATVLISPYMLLNYPIAGTPNGKYQVDFYEIVEYDEDGTNRIYVTINPDGTVIEGVQQDVAGYPRSLAKGYQSGDTVDGGVVTFVPTFQNVPVIRLSGGKAANASFPYDDFGAESSTASGFTCRAKNRNKGTTTVQTAEFTASLTTSAVGGTVGPATVASAPATDNNYKARFDLALSITTTSPPGGQIVAVVAVEVSADAGSTWTEYGTLTKATSRTSPGTTNTDFPGNEVTVNVAGLDPTDKIRLKLKSVTITPGATGSATLEGYNFSPTGEGHGVVYTTSSGGGSSQSKTPDPDDFIFWEAWEKDA